VPQSKRQMRLTPELVARTARQIDDPGDKAHPDLASCTEADHDEAVAGIIAQRSATDDVWVFAYGSLIWNPPFESVDRRIGVVRGWHRSFCLGWIRRFRGSAEHPGLMMALDHGGDCKGLAYRLPADAIRANLVKLFRRELPVKPIAMLPIWADIETDRGTIPALTFVIDREGPRYVGGLSVERLAEVLATAVGNGGSMADYLYQTVKGLEDLEIHDEHLWQLQELVAERIEAAGSKAG
jgi:glutathione-specific gamma-glutamylcyclotransferase